MPGSGTGHFTNAPLFVDQAGGNLRLQTNSSCINTGTNAYAIGAADLDGNPRIVGGTVDMGAYECQSPALLNYYIWLQSYGLPTGASAVYTDSDVDSLNNWQEWLAGTNPTNAASVLRLQQTLVLPAGVTLTLEQRHQSHLPPGARDQPRRASRLLPAANQHPRPFWHDQLHRHQPAGLQPGFLPRRRPAVVRLSRAHSANVASAVIDLLPSGVAEFPRGSFTPKA